MKYINVEDREFIFDEESYKIFIEEFLPDQVPNNLVYCPECNSLDIHYYADYFMCFSCKKKSLIKYSLITKNGYLARIDKITKKIEYFHRFLMNEEINTFANVADYTLNEVHVHHQNENICDNRKSNLTIMSKEEHREHHHEVGQSRAFDTWCSKKYGSYCEPPYSAYEEFERWKESKDGPW